MIMFFLIEIIIIINNKKSSLLLSHLEINQITFPEACLTSSAISHKQILEYLHIVYVIPG